MKQEYHFQNVYIYPKKYIYSIHHNLAGCVFFTVSNRTHAADTKSIIIGDSQTPYIKAQSKKLTDMPSSLQHSGWNVSQLDSAVADFNEDTSVGYVFICIGTNDGYTYTQKVSDLIDDLKATFPNAKLYVIPGSWGWGNVASITPDQVSTYYGKWSGVATLSNKIGKQSDPHNGSLPEYGTIAKEIDGIIPSSSPSGGEGGGRWRNSAGGTAGGITGGEKTTTTGGTTGSIAFSVSNPLNGTSTIPELVTKILHAIVTLLFPIVVIMILYSGFLFITANGVVEKLTTAKHTLTYTLIGAAIVLGAEGLSLLIQNTITCIGGGC
jgi:hypothetical protein